MSEQQRSYKRLSSHGSISVPVALRRQMGLESGDPMEVEQTEDGEIVIRAYQPRCIFCGTTENVTLFKGKGICMECKKTISDKTEEKQHEDSGNKRN